MKIFLLSFFTLLLCISMGVAQEEAHWPLDTNVDDAFGFYHGEMTPDGVSFVDDATRGKVMLLDGITGYVTLPLGLLDFVQDVSITCWFNWAGGADWQRVYSFGNAMPNVRTLYLCPRDGWDGNHLHLTIGGPNGTWHDWNPDTIATNTWYFSAFILKGDSCKLYINDEPWVNTGGVLLKPEDLTPDSANWISKSHWDADATYNGMIDDLRFYPYALSHEEVIALYELPSHVDVPKNTVQKFILNQNYPNPFNQTTTIQFNLAKAENTTLKIYNIAGQEIETLTNGHFSSGVHKVQWNASGQPSGIYFYNIQAGEYSEIKKLILQK